MIQDIMLHSQLNIHYPNSPFVIKSDSLNSFSQLTYSHEVINRDDLIEQINIVDNSDELINQIINLDSQKFTKCIYSIVTQKLSNVNCNTINCVLNMHTTAIRDSSLRESGKGYTICDIFRSTVAWKIVSLDNDIKIHINDASIVFTKQPNISNQNNVTTTNQVQLYPDPKIQTIMNSDGNQLEKDQIRYRTSARKLVVRSNDQNITKKRQDVYEQSVSPYSQHMKYKPESKLINITPKTRASVQEIRAGLSDPHRAFRCRVDPIGFAEQCNIDNIIRQTHINKVDQSNKLIMESREIVNTGMCYQDVGITKTNGIYIFSPITTGRFNIIKNNIESPIHLVSILAHNDILHVTLHNITNS
jgi:hypothetical protein